LDPVDVHGSLRISLAPESDTFDVDEFVDTVAEAVKRLRQMSPLWNQELDYDDIMCKKHSDTCKRC
jgi:cysteine desulfurase